MHVLGWACIKKIIRNKITYYFAKESIFLMHTKIFMIEILKNVHDKDFQIIHDQIIEQ